MKYLYFNEDGILNLVTKIKIDNNLDFIIVPDNFNYQKDITLQDNTIVKMDMNKSQIEESLTYSEKRAIEYPPIEEQFDLLYKDMRNNTTNWQDTIKSIKDKYPKV